MTAKSVLIRPQGLRSGASAPTCPLPVATPLFASFQLFDNAFVLMEVTCKLFKNYIFLDRAQKAEV